MAEREFVVRLKRAPLPPVPPAVQPTEPLPGPTGAAGAKGKDGRVQVVHVGSVGATGPQGPPGPAGGASFVYTQVSPAATWIITHNLNALVSVTLLDTSNNIIDSDIVETNSNVATVIFAQPQAGSAVIVA